MTNTPKMPHNKELEDYILGSCIMDCKMMREVSLHLLADDFYIPENQRLYKYLLDNWERGYVMDEFFISTCKFDALHINDVTTEFAATLPNLMNPIEVVKGLSVQRKLMAITRQAYGEAKIGDDMVGTIDRLSVATLSLNRETIRRVAEPFETSIPKYEREYSDLVGKKIRGELTRREIEYSTGWKQLDELLGGIRCPSFSIIAARPSVGKTAFGLDMSLRVAEQGGTVLFMSLEMSWRALVHRMVANLKSMDSFYIDRIVDPSDLVDVKDGFVMLKNLDYTIDARTLTLTGIKNEVRRFTHERNGLAMVVVDYLQLIRVKGQLRDFERVSRISMELKELARECDTHILAMAQINREGDAKPNMKDIKSSGQIEQDADIILILHEPDKSKRKENDAHLNLNIAKHRHGSTGDFEMVFHKDRCRFIDPSQPPDDIHVSDGEEINEF